MKKQIEEIPEEFKMPIKDCMATVVVSGREPKKITSELIKKLREWAMNMPYKVKTVEIDGVKYFCLDENGRFITEDVCENTPSESQ